MSLINYFNNEINESKNEILISDNNISDNQYTPLKSFQEDFFDNKSLSSNSNITKLINNQFIKEITDKNIISDVLDSDAYYIENDNNVLTPSHIINNNSNFIQINDFENIQSYSEEEKESYEAQKLIYNFDNFDYDPQFSVNLNANLSFSLSSDEIYYYNNNIANNINDISYDNKKCNNEKCNIIKNKEKIFKVIKDMKYRKLKDIKYLEKKRKIRKRGKNKSKNNDIDWDNIPVPKEKHFHLDRKKKRIIFQRKYLKMIYSIVDLEYPFDFLELFNLIKKHVGDKTVKNYGIGKSFHIIKIDDELLIVTMKEKKSILKSKKILNSTKDCSSKK